jgi:multisubunit Na+/H+ antiporter MnhB subunit
MKIDRDKIGVAGLIMGVLLVIILGVFITRNSFPTIENDALTERSISTTQSIGQETSSFMWTYRNIDLIAQAFVLFAAAAGCLAILREEEKKAAED